MCRVTRSGTPRAKIEAEYQRVCKGKPGRPQQAAEEALAVAQQNIAENSAQWDEAYRLFQVINAALGVLASLGLVLPAARPLRIVSASGRAAVQAQLSRIEVQQAANAKAFDIVRQAAANEARFRQFGTN